MNKILELRATVEEIKGRKVVVNTDLSAGGQVCARGRVVAVLVPEQMWDEFLGR